MPEIAEHEKKDRDPDLFGMSGAGRMIERAPPACRRYAQTLYVRGTRGILRADNGDFYATRAGVEAMRAEAARRAARIGGGQRPDDVG